MLPELGSKEGMRNRPESREMSNLTDVIAQNFHSDSNLLGKYRSTGGAKKSKNEGFRISGILHDGRKELMISSPGSAASSSRPMYS